MESSCPNRQDSESMECPVDGKSSMECTPHLFTHANHYQSIERTNVIVVQVGMFEFVRQVVDFGKQVVRRAYHGAHHGSRFDETTLM